MPQGEFLQRNRPASQQEAAVLRSLKNLLFIILCPAHQRGHVPHATAHTRPLSVISRCLIKRYLKEPTSSLRHTNL